MKLQFPDLVSKEIEPYIPALAELRMTVFREYPYLYEGSTAYETSYLQKLAQSPHGYVVLAKDGERVVGASTALPLGDAERELQKPFHDNALDVEQYFYFGESVLLPEYRGRGVGQRFFQERIAQAHFLAFPYACFCAVVRPDDHPARPADYRELTGLWTHFGFQPQPALLAQFGWVDVGETEESRKPMQFWVRPEPSEEYAFS